MDPQLASQSIREGELQNKTFLTQIPLYHKKYFELPIEENLPSLEAFFISLNTFHDSVRENLISGYKEKVNFIMNAMKPEEQAEELKKLTNTTIKNYCKVSK